MPNGMKAFLSSLAKVLAHQLLIALMSGITLSASGKSICKTERSSGIGQKAGALGFVLFMFYI
jgi:hypothetical protein